MNVFNLETVKAVLDMLICYRGGPVSIREIASKTGYSSHHLQRIFRQATGTTLGSYIIKVKLHRAAEALLESQDKISNVYSEFGFTSHNGFTRAFTHYFGMPPARWRATQLSCNKQPDFVRMQLSIINITQPAIAVFMQTSGAVSKLLTEAV